MSRFELRPPTSPRTEEDGHDLEWRPPNDGGGALRTGLSPCLVELGEVSAAAIDLVRVATAAYLADQLQARPSHTFSRTIDLTVHLLKPTDWNEALLDNCANLLTSLTGDRWSITVVHDTSEGVCESDVEPPTARRISLLSGGLDSFAGAVLSSGEEGVVYLGHWDNTIIKGVQDRAAGWFEANGRPIHYTQLRHGVRADKRENSYRSRALLFMALASAVAGARHAAAVEVPENGYTSLNPPLGPERGGALSTRSTHPDTIARFNHILTALAIDVTVSNPHQDKTKGDLVRRAAERFPGDVGAGAALTLSCGKFDGNYYPGGDVNKHCGLCVPCLVRRASLVAAGLDDRTPYLSDILAGAAQAKLIANRSDDILAVKFAIAAGLDEDDLLALAPYPDGFDFDAALRLCRRGLDELARVELP